MNSEEEYLEGNAFMVHQFFTNLLGKPNIRVAYLGDHYWSDVEASAKFKFKEGGVTTMWDGIAVIEELYYEQEPHQRQHLLPVGNNPHLVDTRPYWGPSYFLEGTKRNYFVAEVEKVSRYAIPFVRNLKLLL